MKNSEENQALNNPAAWAMAGAVGKWVGEKVAGGIFGAIGGAAFNQVLTLIGLGGPDLAGKLDQISEQLTQIQRSLDLLNQKTDEILRQFPVLQNFIARSLKQQEMESAMGRLSEFYGAPAGLLSAVEIGAGGRAVNLRLLMDVIPKFPDVTPAYLAQARADFITYVNPVPNELATIHRVLTQPSVDGVSLLQSWATEMVRLVRLGTISVAVAVQFVEEFFLRTISNELMGLTIHCVSLGGDTHGQELIKDYLEQVFHPRIAVQTMAFVEANEFLLFSLVPPVMQVGILTSKGDVPEFSIAQNHALLRADLIAAAINLAGRRLPSGAIESPSVQQAVQGIYGRVLYRPSQLVDGKAPSFGVQGYPPIAARSLGQVPLACIDFADTGDPLGLDLRDLATSTTRVARYFFPFPITVPAVGRPIDPSQRYGIVPDVFHVFGAEGPVTAAGFMDVSRLYQGVAAATAQRINGSMKGVNPYATLHEDFLYSWRHPFGGVTGECWSTGYVAQNIWKADCTFRGNLQQRLFRYTGAPVRVKLTAHITEILRREKRLDTITRPHKYDLIAVLSLRRGGTSRTLFHSIDTLGAAQNLSLNGKRAYAAFHLPFGASFDGAFSIELQLEPGDYELVLDMTATFPDINQSYKYNGWQKSGSSLGVRLLTIERVPATALAESGDEAAATLVPGTFETSSEAYPEPSAEYVSFHLEQAAREEEAEDLDQQDL